MIHHNETTRAKPIEPLLFKGQAWSRGAVQNLWGGRKVSPVLAFDLSEFHYEGSYKELGRVLERYCASYAVEIERLFLLIVFNYATGNGDAHFKNFALVPTPMGDHVLSPAYDLLNTRLHLPEESALALDLFADDFETESFRESGFLRREDFRELARRFRLKPERAERLLERVSGLDAKAASLIEASLLSAEARERYREILADRARALGMGSDPIGTGFRN